jgi:hypothetical protein
MAKLSIIYSFVLFIIEFSKLFFLQFDTMQKFFVFSPNSFAFNTDNGKHVFVMLSLYIFDQHGVATKLVFRLSLNIARKSLTIDNYLNST